jgi:DNA-binding IclR family transcriptional regulator
MATYRTIVKKADWPKVRDGLEQAVKDHEKYGLCFSLGDWNPSVFAVGVPMIPGDRGKVMAFSCFGQVHEITRARIVNDLGPRLVALRDRVRNALGAS